MALSLYDWHRGALPGGVPVNGPAGGENRVREAAAVGRLVLVRFLPPEPGAARSARRALDRFASVLRPQRLYALKVVTSELVAAALRDDPTAPVRVRASLTIPVVRVEVAGGAGCPVVEEPLVARTIDRLTDRWGLEPRTP